MDHDDRAVLAGEIHFYVVDLNNANLAATQLFTADSHFLSLVIDHVDIDSVGIDIGFCLIWSKGKVDSLFPGNVKRIPYTHVICGKAHDPAKEGTVCTVSLVCSGEGTIKDEFYFFQGRRDHLLGKESNACSPCGMRTGRTDHVGTHNVKYTDKRHFA